MTGCSCLCGLGFSSLTIISKVFTRFVNGRSVFGAACRFTRLGGRAFVSILVFMLAGFTIECGIAIRCGTLLSLYRSVC